MYVHSSAILSICLKSRHVPQPILNEAEVASLFSHPLASFLSEDAPFPLQPDSPTAYHTYTDMTDWVPSGPTGPSAPATPRPFRMHRFLTGREASGTNAIKPVYGLTAAILVRTATIGYGHPPAFEVYAPGQWSMQKRVEHALRWNAVFREARWRERIVYPGEEEDWEEWRRKNGVEGPHPKMKARRRGLGVRSRL